MKKSQSFLIQVTVLVAFSVLFPMSCKTTPSEEDSTKKTTPEKPVEPVEIMALTDAEIAAARQALERARLVGANTYFPPEYRALAGELNAAVALGDSDPDAARKDLKAFIVKADALYEKTIVSRANDYTTKFFRADRALLDIEADKFARNDFERTRTLARMAKASYESGDFPTALVKADETLDAQSRLFFNLSENIRYVGILRRDTGNYIGDAEKNEAYLYAPEELGSAVELYMNGVRSYQDYDLSESALLLAEAKKNAVQAARLSAVRKKQRETDLLLFGTQERIETASQLNVLDEEGEVLDARPWDGDAYLRRNPLIDVSDSVDEFEVEEPELRDLDAPLERDGEDFDEIPIEDEGTQVNGAEQEYDLLLMAQEYWQQGVEARNQGRFDVANDYFRSAQAFIEQYESGAVEKTYTVVYKEVATDCLWRIAEYGDIYGNPFLWPKIWRANRKIIQNPDLIYPGQVLVIPPQ